MLSFCTWKAPEGAAAGSLWGGFGVLPCSRPSAAANWPRGLHVLLPGCSIPDLSYEFILRKRRQKPLPEIALCRADLQGEAGAGMSLLGLGLQFCSRSQAGSLVNDTVCCLEASLTAAPALDSRNFYETFQEHPPSLPDSSLSSLGTTHNRSSCFLSVCCA